MKNNKIITSRKNPSIHTFNKNSSCMVMFERGIYIQTATTHSAFVNQLTKSFQAPAILRVMIKSFMTGIYIQVIVVATIQKKTKRSKYKLRVIKLKLNINWLLDYFNVLQTSFFVCSCPPSKSSLIIEHWPLPGLLSMHFLPW